MVTTASGLLSFVIQDRIFGLKLKPTRIWRRLAKMQEMQREKAMQKTGRPSTQEAAVGTFKKLKALKKHTSREKSSKKLK